MITSHNLTGWQSEHDSPATLAPIISNVRHVTGHHITISIGRGSLTLGSESRFRAIYFRKQRPIQPSLRGVKPLNPDVDLGPLALNVVSEQVGDRFAQVKRTTISEVQPCPHPHAPIIRPMRTLEKASVG